MNGEIIIYKYQILENGTLDFKKEKQLNIFASSPYSTFKEHSTDPIFKALIYNDNLITGQESGKFCHWDIKNAGMFFKSKLHTDTITSMILGPNNCVLISSIDQNITVYDIANKFLVQQINLGQSIQNLFYCKEKNMVYCVCNFNLIIELSCNDKGSYCILRAFSVGEEKY